MSSKSKSRKRKRRRGSDSVKREPLVERLQSSGFLQGRKLVFQPDGKEKMSEVILEFVEPYMQSPVEQPMFERLIAVATLAWNAALLDEKDSHALVEQTVNAVIPSDDRQARSDLWQIINMMIERKKRHFAKFKRYILNYHVTKTKDGLHLSVASTL